MAGRLAGKVAVVTGAAQGIGRGCAELMAQEGARVVIGDLQIEVGQATAQAIRDRGGEAWFLSTDVVDEAQCAALIGQTVQRYGRLDVLVNNVGIFPRATLEETTTELWEHVLNVTLRSAMYCCKYAVMPMREAGGGSIINMGSIAGIQGLVNHIPYAAAKGGLLALTRTLAGAYGADRIRANYIIPGWVLSEGEQALQRRRGVSAAALEQAGQALRFGRHQTALDAAYAVVYLASDEASQITGTVLHVDAGASSLPIPPGAPYVG